MSGARPAALRRALPPAAVFAILSADQAQTGRFAEALANLRKAYAHYPGFPGSVKELARALVTAADFERTAGHPDQAMALYQEAPAVQPANAPARDGLEALTAGGARPGRSHPRRARP